MYSKISLALTIMCVSGLSVAHSQSPHIIERVTPWEKENVSINIFNVNDYQQKYEILVDNKPLGKTDYVEANNQVKINISLQTKLEEETHREVCSVSIPDEQGQVRTRICTTVKLFRPRT